MEYYDIILNHSYNSSVTSPNASNQKINEFVEACKKGTPLDLKRFLQLESRPGLVNSKNENGESPITNASAYSNYDAITFLLESGAQVNLKDNYGSTPLHWASYCGNIRILQLLLANGANIYEKDNKNDTPLLITIRSCRLQAMLLLLNTRNEGREEITLNSLHTDKDGNTPLMISAALGHIQFVKLLLSYNADMMLQNKFGYTALHYACEKGFLSIIQYLLNDWMLKHTTRGDEDDTPSTSSNNVFTIVDENGNSPLFIAVIYYQYDVIKYLLSYCITSNTAATITTTSSNTIITFDINYTNHNGETALLKACQNNLKYNNNDNNNNNIQIEMVKLLLTVKSINIDTQSKSGNTALMVAILEGKKDLLQLLLRRGASLELKNKGGVTALDLLHSNSNKFDYQSIITRELKYRANISLRQALFLSYFAITGNKSSLNDEEKDTVSTATKLIRAAAAQSATSNIFYFLRIRNYDAWRVTVTFLIE